MASDLTNESVSRERMTEKGLRTRWEVALEEADCVKVRELVEDDPSLKYSPLWEEKAKGSLRHKPVWTGRTALHVATMRGDVALVNEILKIAEKSKSTLVEVVDEPTWLADEPTRLIVEPTGLTALAMAVINGNKEIVDLLQNFIKSGSASQDNQEGGNDSHITTVKEILKKYLGQYSQIQQLYAADRDFNFLDIEKFFFHFIFSGRKFLDHNQQTLEEKMYEMANEIVEEARKPEDILDYLLSEFRDGQGRTALHVAADNFKVKEFLAAIGFDDKDQKFRNVKDEKFLNVKDAAGRTPLFRAAAQNIESSVTDLLKAKTKVDPIFSYAANKWGDDLDLDKLSSENGFKSEAVFTPLKRLQDDESYSQKNGQTVNPAGISLTALHIATIYKCEGIVDKLLAAMPKDSTVAKNPRCGRPFNLPAAAVRKAENIFRQGITKKDMTSVQLGVLMGNGTIMESLLKGYEHGRFGTPLLDVDTDELRTAPSYLLAASLGKPEIVGAFASSKNRRFDVFLKDDMGNTALHYAVNGKHTVQSHPHLVEFASCLHVSQWRKANDEVANTLSKRENGNASEDSYGIRKGCINFLLQLGLDPLSRNHEEKTPTPNPDAPDEFVAWWVEKVGQHTQDELQTLNGSAAANAVAVTAALVATASYLGPFTAPLGYSGDPAGMQVNILAVRIFVVTDTLSFYLALTTIMLALLPSVSLPGQSIFKELARARILMAASVACLLPSIICVLLAFTAAYSAAVPEDGLAHHGISVAATVCGGALFFLVMCIFSSKLFKVLGSLEYGEMWSLVKELFTDFIVPSRPGRGRKDELKPITAVDHPLAIVVATKSQ